MTKNLIITGLILFLIYSLLFIINLWSSIFDPAIFFRISLTFGIFIGVILVVIVVLYTLDEEASLKGSKHLG